MAREFGSLSLPVKGIDDLHCLLTHEQVGQRSPLPLIRRNEKVTVNIVPEEMKS